MDPEVVTVKPDGAVSAEQTTGFVYYAVTVFGHVNARICRSSY